MVKRGSKNSEGFQWVGNVLRCTNPVGWNKYLFKKDKNGLYNSVFLSMLLYGCQSWVYQKQYKRKLNVAGIGYLRSMYGKRRRNGIKNEWLLNNTYWIQNWKIGAEKHSEVAWSQKEKEWRLNSKQIHGAKRNLFRGRRRQRNSLLEGINKALKKEKVRSLKNKSYYMKQGIYLVETISNWKDKRCKDV